MKNFLIFILIIVLIYSFPFTFDNINQKAIDLEHKSNLKLNQGNYYISSFGHIYTIFEGNFDWNYAKNDCDTQNAHLVTITNIKEQEFVYEITNGIPTWIGLTDEREDGKWEWITGEPFIYSSWRSGEPSSNNPLTENYAFMEAPGVWGDAFVNEEFSYICESTGNFRNSLFFSASFNEGVGQTTYDSIEGDECQIFNAQWTSGYTDNALLFNGNDSLVDCGFDPRYETSEYSIEAWFNVRGDTTSVFAQNIAGRRINPRVGYGPYSIELNKEGTGVNFFGFEHFGFTATGIVSLNSWTHIVGTFKNNLFSLYINGTFVGSNNETNYSTYYSDAPLTIGAYAGNGDNFNGTIDEVKIYNKALSDEQVFHSFYNSSYTSNIDSDSSYDNDSDLISNLVENRIRTNPFDFFSFPLIPLNSLYLLIISTLLLPLMLYGLIFLIFKINRYKTKINAPSIILMLKVWRSDFPDYPSYEKATLVGAKTSDEYKLVLKYEIPNFQIASEIIEGKFNCYDEFLMAKALGASSIDEYKLIQKYNAPDLEIALEIFSGGFDNYETYEKAKLAGCATYKDYLDLNRN